MRKSLESLLSEVKIGGLKKNLSSFDLIMIGIGAIIGTGIFVVTGIVAAKYAGPAVMLSFLIAGIVSSFTAFAYAELSAALPVAGSAYSYCYVAFGRLAAWMAGYMILMAYLFGASMVSVGWSGYVAGLFPFLPEYLVKIPAEGGIVNLPSIFIIWFISIIAIRGMKESSIMNIILIIIKISMVLLFVIIAFPYAKLENITNNFLPFGMDGVLLGAATVFIGFAGFDTIAMAAEESKNPKRDLPIGLLVSLVVCTLMYIVVSGSLTAIIPYYKLDNAEPMAFALRENGSYIGSALVAVGAIAGMSTVLITQVFGLSRLQFTMARDKMLPGLFAKLHSKYKTPYQAILLNATIISIIAGFLPTALIGNVTAIAILANFIIVSIAVMAIRKQYPDLKRPFTCPALFVVAPISILACGYLIMKLVQESYTEFLLAIGIGVIIYVVRKALTSESN